MAQRAARRKWTEKSHAKRAARTAGPGEKNDVLFWLYVIPISTVAVCVHLTFQLVTSECVTLVVRISQ